MEARGINILTPHSAPSDEDTRCSSSYVPSTIYEERLTPIITQEKDMEGPRGETEKGGPLEKGWRSSINRKRRKTNISSS